MADLFHVIDPRQFDRLRLDELCLLTDAVRQVARSREGGQFLQSLLPHRRAMLYFTQPSTRTFLSFNNACHILGMRTSEIRDASTSSEVKGESLEDSIRTFSSYVDVIIMRTWEEGVAARSAAMMDRVPRRVPIVNAGSGKDLHPTQSLLDIYTLQSSFVGRGGIDGKVIGIMGDLRRGRTVRSLCYLMRNYQEVELVLIAPPAFAIGGDIKDFMHIHGIRFRETEDLQSVLPELDAIYVTRLQSEHDQPGQRQELDYSRFSIGPAEMQRLRPDAAVMHPLPRGQEISPEVDDDPRATYWRQERNGMWMRVALLLKLFRVDDRILSGRPPQH